MHRVPVLVADERKAARQHAAIGQCRQQLSAVSDSRVEPLHQRHERTLRAFGQPLRAFAAAGDGVALRLRVGKL